MRGNTTGRISRRELLKAGVGLGVALSGLGVAHGNAVSETLTDNASSVKGDSGFKIKPPDKNCLIGFYKPDVPSLAIDHYRKSFTAKPSLFALWHLLSERFPMVEAKTIRNNGVVPYINIYPGVTAQKSWKEIFSPNDIVKGRSDSHLKRLAEESVRFGEKHGGFFLTALVEFNAEWWPWSRKPDSTPALRHIWQIFEDQGANRYATWVWEAFCPTRYERRVEDPEPYFPGDKYVDWIGMNAFANLKNPYVLETTMLRELLSPTYEQMARNHPQKSMMLSEFGRTPGENQPSWLTDAYRSIRDEFPRIKAAIYYDNVTNVYGGQDHTLDQKSLSTLKDVFKDPYWIMSGATAG